MELRVIKLAFGQAGDKFKLELKSSGNVDISKLKEGDLILRKVLFPRKKLYHAGIYCGRNEVIQFTSNGQTQTSSSSSCCSSSNSSRSPNEQGLVDKISVKNFISGQFFRVYRLKDGPPEDILQNIMNAWDDNQEYNLFTNNCLHFALKILGCSPGPMPESPPQNTDKGLLMEERTRLVN